MTARYIYIESVRAVQGEHRGAKCLGAEEEEKRKKITRELKSRAKQRSLLDRYSCIERAMERAPKFKKERSEWSNNSRGGPIGDKVGENTGKKWARA